MITILLTDPVSTLSCTIRAVAAVGSGVVPFFSLASMLFYKIMCSSIAYNTVSINMCIYIRILYLS